MTGFVTAGEGSADLLGPAGHDLLDHTAGPLNLLDATAHNALDHTAGPLSLMSVAAHNALDHTTEPGTNVNPAQVSPTERTAGSEGTLRSFSPFDVATMSGIHGNPGGKVVQRVLTPITASTVITIVTPADNTIPQFTEGQLIATVSITPQAVGNILEFEFWGWGTLPGVSTTLVIHMHQNSAANAFAAGLDLWNGAPGSSGGMWNLKAQIVGGLPLISTPFQLRLGSALGVGGPHRLNGGIAGIALGTARISSFSVIEYTP